MNWKTLIAEGLEARACSKEYRMSDKELLEILLDLSNDIDELKHKMDTLKRALGIWKTMPKDNDDVPEFLEKWLKS